MAARPIDVLSKNLLLDDTFDMEMTEPYKIFRGLPMVRIAPGLMRTELALDMEVKRNHRNRRWALTNLYTMNDLMQHQGHLTTMMAYFAE